jgi:thiol-disulfide isomerase/thioredoxin
MKQKRFIYLVFGIIGIIFLSGCIQQSPPKEAPQTGGVKSAWMDIQLKDIATGNNFKISDFKGKPVVLESFAVWCPTCLKQQKEIKELKSREGNAIIHISLDIDPNEDEAKVREHLKNTVLTGILQFHLSSLPML